MNLYQYFENLTSKTIILYHGLRGNSSSSRKRILKKFGANLIQATHDYEKEYEFDKGKSFMKKQEAEANKASTIMGISFGGYVAFKLACELEKPLILINPALNRAVSRTGIKEYEYETQKKPSKIEIFYGEKDDKVSINEQKKTLNDFTNVKYIEIPEMEHRVPDKFFEKICELSKILK